MVVSSHYRSSLAYTDEALQASMKAVRRLDRVRKDVRDYVSCYDEYVEGKGVGDPSRGASLSSADSPLVKTCLEEAEKF